MLNCVLLLERKVALAQENHSHPSCDKEIQTFLPLHRAGGNPICSMYIPAVSKLTKNIVY